MSSIRIEFDTDNAAFRDEDGALDPYGVIDIIDKARERLLAGSLPGEYSVPLIDFNGNNVGELAIVEDARG